MAMLRQLTFLPQDSEAIPLLPEDLEEVIEVMAALLLAVLRAEEGMEVADDE